MLRPLPLFLVSLLAAACSVDLPLPTQPSAAQAPELNGFTPEAAFAGETLALDFVPHGDAIELELRFGTSLPVHPVLSGGRWSVVVPDDATSGPLEAWNGKASANSAKSFTFKGPGHLRHGRQTASRSLLPRLVRVVASSEREATFGLWRGSDMALVVDEIGTITSFLEVDGLRPLSLALNPAGSALVVVGVRDDCPLVGIAEALAVHVYDLSFEDAPGELPAPRATRCLTVADESALPEVATNEDATLVGVVTRSAFAVVDVATGAGQVRLGDRAEPPRGIAWLGGPSFLTLNGTNFVRGAADRPVAQWDVVDYVADAEADGEPAYALAAVPGGTLALGLSTGRVLLTDDEGRWPPAFTQGLPFVPTSVTYADATSQIYGLAFSRDGQTLALTQPLLDRALVAQPGAEGWDVVGTIAAQRPQWLSAAGDGFFVMTTGEGGVGFSSTGARLASFAHASLIVDVAVAGPCGGASSSVVLASRTFGSVRRVDFTSLLESPCPVVSNRNDVREVDGDPVTGAVFLRVDGAELVRVSADGRLESNTHFEAATTVQGMTSGNRVVVLPGGRVAALDGPTRLRFFDGRAPVWADAHVASQQVAPADELLEGPGGDPVLIYEGKLVRVGVEAALLGETAITETALPPSTVAVALSPYGAVVVDSATPGERRFSVGGADLQLRAALSMRVRSVRSIEVSPDGRRVYVLVLTESGVVHVVRLKVDWQERTLVEVESPLAIEESGEAHVFNELAMSPDGARLVAFDPRGEVLVAFE